MSSESVGRWGAAAASASAVVVLMSTIFWPGALHRQIPDVVTELTLALALGMTALALWLWPLHAAAAKLVETDQRLRLLLDSTAEAIYGMDMEANCTFVNTACLNLLGYKEPGELLGRDMHELTHRDLKENKPLDKLECRICQALLQGKEAHIDDAVIWNTSRASFPAEYWSRPIMAGERRAGAVVSFIDITDRKWTEEVLQGQADELLRSNQELEQFAYVASHDLQEPLRMVASYTQLLEKRYYDKLDQEGHEFIHYATDGAKRMQELINDLLSYSRVNTRAKPSVPTDVTICYERALANLRIAIEESEAKVTHAPLPNVKADPSQITELLQNLIGNAIKYRGGRKPEIHVGALRNGKEWRLWVKDNGIGIDPKYFERIFVIFQRLHSRENYPGTGIGLAICKKIVERHGGRIWVESKPEEGTTFLFTLPAVMGTKS